MKLSKRSCRVLAAVLILAALAGVSVGTVAWAAGFTDVSSSAWYYDAVNFVTSKGLFNGTSSTQFSPNGVMTRAMFITVLGRYAHVDPDTWLAGQITGSGVNMRSGPSLGSGVVAVLSQGASVTLAGRTGDWYKVRRGSQTGYVNAQYVSPRYHAFSDVDYSQYYAGYAVWAYEKNIVEGVGSASVFSPNGNVTRQQVCTLLDRFASFMGLKLAQNAPAVTFNDSASISSWAKSAVTTMQRAGVIEGMGNGNFEPNGSATRAQCAAMLMRFDKACSGGNTPSTMPPAPTLRPTPTPTQRPIPTPPPDKPLIPGYPADTPATFIGGTVKPRFTVVRVGLYVSTKTYNTCLSQVPLYNVNGGSFEYGIMGADRQFYAAGTIGDRSITVTVSGNDFTIRDSAGRVAQTITTGALAIHPTGSKGLTRVNNNYSYNGDFELRPAANAPGKITVINFVDIEDYVKGVLPWEFGTSWPAETLKAAAVASRSHIQKTDLVYLSFGIDVVASDGTQAYLGRRTYGDSYFAATDAAADATAGQYLTYNGDICLCSFSACDGGQTLSAQQVFGANYPYLISKQDPYETYVKNEIPSYDSLVRASHRVGLSQWGAYAMGKYFDKNYMDILGFYYTGTHLQYGA